MKKLKKFVLLLLTVVMIAASVMPVSAAASAPASKNAAGGYYIPASMTIQVGERQKLVVKQPAGKYANVSFQYSPNYVTSSGYSAGAYWGKPAEITYTGKRAGSFISYVTVNVFSRPGVPSSSCGRYTLQCYVNVVDKKASSNPFYSLKRIALQKISLTRGALTLNVGAMSSLSVNFFPFNTTDSKAVSWSSSNASVVSVVNGRLTAKKVGTATITAKVGIRVATCRVTVKAPLRSISLNRSSAVLTAGKSTNLSVYYNPSNTTDSRNVIWSSSNNAVATVNRGKVVAKKAGTATITAKVGTKKAVCRVTVKAAPSSTGSSSKTSTSSGSKTSASSGTYKNVADAYSILNTFRTTSSNQWYWNPNNTTKTTTYGLKALTKDTALENTAKLRAKEAWTMYYEKGRATHDRPNGTSCFTAYPAGLTAKGENLAWGQTTSRTVILDPNYGWAETNSKYSGQGHRRNMLNSNYTKVGIACYEKNGKTCWAMCLGR